MTTEPVPSLDVVLPRQRRESDSRARARAAAPPTARRSLVPVDAPVASARPEWQYALTRARMIGDGAAACAAGTVFVAATGLRPLAPHLVAVLGFAVVWVLACASTRAYESRFLGDGNEEYRRIVDAGLRVLAISALALTALRFDYALQVAVIGVPATVGATLTGRAFGRRALHRKRAAGGCIHKVIAVGRERACAELIRQFHSSAFAGFSVVGVCVDVSRDAHVEGVPVVGTSQSVVAAVERTGADTVAVGAWSDLSQQEVRRLSWELEGTGVDLVVAPTLFHATESRLHIRPVAGLPLLHVNQPEFTGGRRLLKHLFDRGSALAALVILCPLLVAIAVCIRLTSPGPAIFRQVRVGRGGREFTIIKFRSMYVDAEARLEGLRAANEHVGGLLFKMRDDPRVTPVGRWLRRLSIDELPQLVNVVRGEMSLVGPRPPLPAEVSQYQSDVRRRLLVRPGLTGLWQISGRSDLTWDESIRLDLHYVENWSLPLDLAIIWKTLAVVLAKRGAY